MSFAVGFQSLGSFSALFHRCAGYPVKPAGMFDEAAAGHLRAILEQGALGAGAFDTDDCQATYAELSPKGVEFLSPPQEQPYGIEAIFRDNSGNWFSLTQHR